MCNDSGSVKIFQTVSDSKDLEQQCRETVIAMECAAGISIPPLQSKEVQQFCVPNTLSQCFYLGKSVLEARANKTNPVEAFLQSQGGKLLFCGKVVDVDRNTAGEED